MSLAAESRQPEHVGLWDVVRDKIWMDGPRDGAFVWLRAGMLAWIIATLISRRGIPKTVAARSCGDQRRAIETQGYLRHGVIRVLLPKWGTLRWIGARGHCMNVG